MRELESHLYERVRPLTSDLVAYNVAISALLDGINPGRIFVDDPDNPQAAFIETVEGRHLVGDPTIAVFVVPLESYFRAVFSAHTVYISVDSTAWAGLLSVLFPSRKILQKARRHYVCTALADPNWRAGIPDGFSVRRIDANLLDDTALDVPDHIHSWIKFNWGTREYYEQHGFGFCTLHEHQVVSWSLADCVSGQRAEIGIHTHPDYRRRGLAAITAAACVDHALANGFTEIGWHCDDDNIGSWKTAEKAGFAHERNYTLYYCLP